MHEHDDGYVHEPNDRIPATADTAAESFGGTEAEAEQGDVVGEDEAS